jgi:hypothetical protein
MVTEKKTKKAAPKKKDIETNVPSGGWPVISQGTHLTVKTFEDGTTELIWDDVQLLKEVQEAISSYEKIESVTPKKTKGKKNVSTQ